MEWMNEYKSPSTTRRTGCQPELNLEMDTTPRLDKALPQTPRSLRTGWRFTMACGLVCVFLTFLCNTVLLIWSSRQPRSGNQNSLIFSGDCDEKNSVVTWLHLAINMLSTLLLGGTNQAQQVLVAPLRSDIDAAHAKHKTLDIAVPSISNWKFMNWRRRTLYLALFGSGILLHLFYNAVIVSTDIAIQYRLTIVSSDFLRYNPNDSSMNRVISQDATAYFIKEKSIIESSSSDVMSKNLTQQLWYEGNNLSLMNADSSKCRSIFSSPYKSSYSDIVVFTDYSSITSGYNQSLLYYGQPNNSWQQYGNPNSYSCSSCGEWMLTAQVYFSTYSPNIQRPPTYHTIVKAESCLLKEVERICTIELIPSVLGMVMACNMISGIVLIFLLFSDIVAEPILALGDAVASFLDSADPHTRGLGGLSINDIRSSLVPDVSSSSKHETDFRQWQPNHHRNVSGASLFRWMASLHLFFNHWILGLAIFLMGGLLRGTGLYRQTASIDQQWHLGFGNQVVDGLYFEPPALHNVTNSVIRNTILANIPQLILASMYFAGNALLTYMSVSAEWAGYSQKKARGLRVTNPAGLQRSTYWISLPFKISIPVMTVFGICHWLLSQSIYVLRVDMYDPDGTKSDESINGIGLSPVALGFLLAAMLIVPLTILVYGLRKLPAAPLVSCNSWAISANCHAIRPGESFKKLRYGVIENLNGRYRVGFSSGSVRALKAGECYE